MKRELSPVVIAVSVLVLIGAVAFFFWHSGNTTVEDKPASSMPPQVAAELQKRLGGVQPPGVGSNMPSSQPGNTVAPR